MRTIDADALIEYELKRGILQKAFISLVKRQPTVGRKRKDGIWIEKDDCYACECCGARSPSEYRYCPHCGARLGYDSRP